MILVKLFIVESPTKIKTLKKFLKNHFVFKATSGHIKDLPKNRLGVNLNTFLPSLYYLPGKRKLLSKLKKYILKVNEVYLATDPDREGEAIAYHLYEYLSKINSHLKFKRIDLIEITPQGIKNALKSSRKIDLNLYQSWLTRRVMDRIIGYLISPYICKAFKKQGLSSGRVQSIALRLMVEREKEIKNFVPKTNYSLEVLLKNNELSIWTELYFKNRVFVTNEKEEIINWYKKISSESNFVLKEIKEKIETKIPPDPLKTTTLIEICQKILGFDPKKTMKYAQNLYEKGYITYMRTDSTRVSKYAKNMAKKFIKHYFGEEFIGQKRKISQTKFIQDAHECIRPTDVFKEDIPLSFEEKALYQVIRLYFIASQMNSAKYLVRAYVFKNESLGKYFKLVLISKKLIFEGFLKIFPRKEKQIFLDLKKGEIFKVLECKIKTHLSKPPPRYTPATLIKTLESMGIGRPSTYASLLDILYKRGYIEKENFYLKPTFLGIEVCDFLMNKFPEFLDYEFTVKMEEDLEKIVKNKKTYKEIVSFTYEILKNRLEKVQNS